jgi:hypothetical protein
MVWAGLLSVIAWSIGGDVKDIYLPRLEGEDIFLPLIVSGSYSAALGYV